MVAVENAFKLLILVSAGLGASLISSCSLGGDAFYLHIIWQNHQPLLIDPAGKDHLIAPEVRIASTRDYYAMASIWREFPDLHVTVNLSFPLVHQLETFYLDRLLPFLDKGKSRIDAEKFLAKWNGQTDPWIDLALTPSEKFGEKELELLRSGAWSCFSVPEAVINFFPQFLSLRSKNPAEYTVEDKTAIKCWSYLANFAPAFLDGPVELASGGQVDLSDLVEMQPAGTYWLRRPLTEDDANRLVAEAVKVMEATLAIYRAMGLDPHSGGGQIELITTPLFHPALPLLYDSSLARVSQPAVDLPDRFSYPRDVAYHVQRASQTFRQIFGNAPEGMWPPDGAVAPEILSYFLESGVRWVATGDRVLRGSRPRDLPLDQAYRVSTTDPRASGNLVMVFCDTDLAGELLGEAQASETDLAVDGAIARLLEYPAGAPDRLITLVFDSSKAWERFHQDLGGKKFLRAFYRRLDELQESGSVITVTLSEYLNGNLARKIPPHPPQDMPPLERLWAGSWTDGTFSGWIGDARKNKAWKYLLQARKDLEASSIRSPDPGALPPSEKGRSTNGFLAWQSMYMAESSEWFEWFRAERFAKTGVEGSPSPGEEEVKILKARALVMERIFLKHLKNVYDHAAQAGARMPRQEFPPISATP
ncbi:MAG: hypothetical protein HY717_16895 [Planctomycetes bacterium]|nr:hypothetical protein [Planctomycetota bacterium]